MDDLSRAHAIFVRSVLRPLSVQQFRALNEVCAQGKTTMKNICRTAGTKPPTACVIVDHLVSERLVVRRRSNEQDRRVVELRPTARGLRLWKTLKQRMHEAVLGLTKDLPKDDLQDMAQILEDLTTRLERW
jgi:DNA-binding MarR family transcriptional regulator